jgi:hypothetical protein
MTPEDLLKPRYKVIADYPGCRWEVGHIIEMKRVATSVDDKYFDNYPHLFQPLKWYEERKPEDMPEYVKSERTGAIHITKYDFETNTIFWDDCPFTLSMFLSTKMPATKEEYDTYKQQGNPEYKNIPGKNLLK